MILHGYVNYAGSPLNYSGSPEYDILRAIESGANPYNILAFQNSAYMKDAPNLNKYYGVDYANWYDEIVVTYQTMNNIFKDIQDYKIVDHKVVIAERTAEASERLANYNILKAEVLDLLRNQIIRESDAAVNEAGNAVKVNVNVDSIFAQISDSILAEYKNEIDADVADEVNALKEAIRLIADEFSAEYPGLEGQNNIAVEISELKYQNEKGEAIVPSHYSEYSEHSFTTDSECDAVDYIETEYTLYNNNVVIVTYQKGDSVVSYLLNYNLFDVRVNIGGVVHDLSTYGYKKL